MAEGRASGPPFVPRRIQARHLGALGDPGFAASSSLGLPPRLDCESVRGRPEALTR